MTTGPAPERWRPRVVSVEGRFIEASNATLLATADDGTRVVYKPVAGQRPLWDFDAATLPMREVLTYETSRRMGFDVVPPTVMIDDGPFGPGSVQRYVAGDDEFDPLRLARDADPGLWPIAALDVVTNNADRKLGHLLRIGDRIVGIDHGLTFHADDKLRTVLWSFAGRAWPEHALSAFRSLLTSLDGSPEPYAVALQSEELDAFRRRIELALALGTHPDPPDDRPAMPWPPY